MLKKHGDWMELGSADEGKTAKVQTVEGRVDRGVAGGQVPCRIDPLPVPRQG